MPYAYRLDLCHVRQHVTHLVAAAEQAWRATGGGGQERESLWKNKVAVVLCLCLRSTLCAFLGSSLPSFHVCSDASHVPTSDSDLHDVIGLCLPAALWKPVCVLVPACGCLHLSEFASVNMCGLTASQLKLQEGKKKKKTELRAQIYLYLRAIKGKCGNLRASHAFFISCKVCGFRWGLFLGRSETASRQEKADCSTTEVMREI